MDRGGQRWTEVDRGGQRRTAPRHRRCHRSRPDPQNPRPPPAACAAKPAHETAAHGTAAHGTAAQGTAAPATATKVRPVSLKPCPTGLPTAGRPGNRQPCAHESRTSRFPPMPLRPSPGRLQKMPLPANHPQPRCPINLQYRTRLDSYTSRKTPVILPHIDAPIANLKTSTAPERVLTLD